MDISEKNLSQEFQDVYKSFLELKEDSSELSQDEKTETAKKLIKRLENLTLGVSVVQMFSKNEHYKELDPKSLKFLLLPYLLGCLWQSMIYEDRPNVLELTKVYFEDFLRRCQDYEFIVKNDIEEMTENEKKSENKKAVDSDAVRRKKVQRFKANRELDEKIEKLWKNKESEEEMDEDVLQPLYESLIRRAINDSEECLEFVTQEKEVLQYAATKNKQGEPLQPSKDPPKPLKPFIITKDAVQKEVFGLGYPSLPVMTVEELYAQRMASGEWKAPPPQGKLRNPEELAVDEDAQREKLEEDDDPIELARKRNFDEYKDDHRRGWGNRFNRS